MRWDIIKKAWTLAKEKFPKTERLYVDLPDQFRGFGECSIIDLDKPEEKLAKIVYEAHCDKGKPILSLRLENSLTEAEMPKASIQLKSEAAIQPLLQKNSISASDIMDKYQDPAVLGEQLAYLIAGHEDGIKTASIDEDQVDQWLERYGFAPESIFHVEPKLAEMGIILARRKKMKKFKNYEKVRVVDPRIMEYNEGAQVVGRRRDKEKNDWYQVIVDGSDKPIWLHEDQLAKNEVGSIKEVSSLDIQEDK